jgi:hypothetical protein
VPAPPPRPVVETPTVTANQNRDVPALSKPAASAVPMTGAAALTAASAAALKPKVRDTQLANKPAPRPDGALVPLPEQQRVVERPVPRPEEGPPNYQSAAAAKPVPPVPVQQGPASPREACGGRVFLALAVCMEEKCVTPRFRAHPQCDEVRQMMDRRRRGEN